MNKKMTNILMTTVLLATGVGCVSTSKYKKLETDHQAIKKQLDAANAKTADLETQLSSTQQQAAELQKQSEETKNQYQGVLNQLQQEVQQGNLKITQYQNMLRVDVAEQIFFDSGSAKLKKSGQAVLKKVGDALKSYDDKLIRVVGHTDNVPLAKSFQDVFPSNWELSVLRATNVVRFLQDQAGIVPERLIASGRGEYDPVAPNDTKEGRQKNRRIEIMLLDKSMVDSMTKASQ